MSSARTGCGLRSMQPRLATHARPGRLVDHDLVRRPAGWERQRRDPHPLGPVVGRPLLEERLLVDPVDEALEGHRPAADAAQRAVGDGEEVAHDVELRVARHGEVDLVRVRDRDLAAADLEDLLARRHGRNPRRAEQSGHVLGGHAVAGSGRRGRRGWPRLETGRILTSAGPASDVAPDARRPMAATEAQLTWIWRPNPGRRRAKPGPPTGITTTRPGPHRPVVCRPSSPRSSPASSIDRIGSSSSAAATVATRCSSRATATTWSASTPRPRQSRLCSPPGLGVRAAFVHAGHRGAGPLRPDPGRSRTPPRIRAVLPARDHGDRGRDAARPRRRRSPSPVTCWPSSIGRSGIRAVQR